jgi:hypothetical protein
MVIGRSCTVGVAVVAAVWSGVALASPKPLPLRARLLRQRDFPGFRLETAKSYTAKAWVTTDQSLSAAQVKAQIARLEREGFKGLLSEYLDDAQGPRNGVSWVMQLGSAASARAELAATVSYEKTSGNAPESFRVKAIPKSFGFGGTNGPGSGGENVTFADGPFLYLLGNAWSGSTHNPKHAALIAAATKLYDRVHGHPAG